MKILKIISLVIICLVFSIFITPIAWAQGGLVPCQDNCTAADFFTLASKVVDFFVFTLAVPAAVIAITYAGVQMAIHPTQAGKRSEAKGIIMTAVIGLALALGAWLIVTTITDYLLKDTPRSGVNQSFPSGT